MLVQNRLINYTNNLYKNITFLEIVICKMQFPAFEAFLEAIVYLMKVCPKIVACAFGLHSSPGPDRGQTEGKQVQ